MNPEQIALLINPLGVFIPLVFALGVAAVHARRYFRLWTASYALLFGALMLDAVGVVGGRPAALATLEVVTYVASGWASVLAGRAIVGRTVPLSVSLPLVTAPAVYYVIATVMGARFDVAVMPTLIYYLGTQARLGLDILHDPAHRGALKRWLGGLVIATGLVGLANPLLPEAGTAWVGLVLAGLLHLILGMGMIMYVLGELEGRLRAQYAEMREMQRIQADFIGNISHEFRTPLTAIKMAAWLLARSETGNLTADQREIVGLLETNIERFVGLVDDALAITRFESGELGYAFTRVDLREALAGAVLALEYLFVDKGVAIALDLPEEPLEAEIDERRIVQGLVHLLSNAAKFTPPGGHVRVSLAGTPTAARIAIRDDGVGIAPENLSRVFMRFYQEDTSMTRAAGGAGLGLAIARAIVEDGHHGTIVITRNAERGVTVTFEVPRVAARAADGAPGGPESL